MGETHNHQAPPLVQAPPQGPPPANLGLSRGPTWTPAEQLLQLHYCIHSNPSWRKSLSLLPPLYIYVSDSDSDSSLFY